MDYKIENLNLLPEQTQEPFREYIEKKKSGIERFFKRYKKPITLEIHISELKNNHYSISFLIQMKESPVYVRETGSQPIDLATQLFQKIKRTVARQLKKERKEYLYKRKNRHISSISDYTEELEEIRSTKDQESFNQLLKRILPNIKDYVNRRVKMAELQRLIERREYKEDDLVDEID